MIGCHIGRMLQVTVAGGSYQEGLTAVVQGHPSGMLLTEQEIYSDFLLRKPGADKLSSPRKEPDLPIIYSGLNAADTIENAGNKNHTNGTPLSILIPNLDRHFIHIKQYQDTNRTPRPGHASYASFAKYGPDDDAIGAGFFSGRYTSTIVAAGYVAKKVLKKCGIDVFAYVKEIAGVRCPDIPHDKALKLSTKQIREKYNVHHVLNCPDIDAAEAMVDACNKISATGDSAGGVVEVIVTGVPVGLGEPVFCKLDAELGRMLGIGAVKGVEVGAGFRVKDMTGSEDNDQMRSQNGKVIFDSNNAGGITGGLATGQPIVVRLAVKQTPTIANPQHPIEK